MLRAERPSGRPLLFTLCVVFFISGASALTYQLLWLRVLGLIFGVTVYAASTVWASFMAGLAIGSVISFASMLMASQVGEAAALKLHATELLILLGTAIVLLVERPAQVEARIDNNATSGDLRLQQSQFPKHR